MVKAELSHNPYILETKVKFNNQLPKINSLIEKYEQKNLHTWIDKIPTIFYQEMNGYDFEFDFSGTETDFQAVVEQFLAQGLIVVSESKQTGRRMRQRQGEGVVELSGNNHEILQPNVWLFLKNELDDARSTSQAIDELMAWFRHVPNRRFDFEKFKKQHYEILIEDYSYLFIQGRKMAIPEKFAEDITLENIETVAELPTDLINTPILFFLDSETLPNFWNLFENIAKRTDVHENQLFFYIDEQLNTVQIERTIQDLGIQKPQIVTTADDLKIQHFFEIYPIIDYIHAAIVIFQDKIQQITSELVVENERSRQQNSQIRETIDQLEQLICNLKLSDELIVKRDNFELTDQIQSFQVEFFDQIHNWRKKKSQLTSDEEALKAANEYEQDLQEYFGLFT
ncbi:MAG: hypothetical protein ACRC1D_02460, partial [Culicoidibacterales bacterium]